MLSKEFLIKRKQCCGNGCFMCPYLPRHKKGSIDLNLNLGYACQNMQLSHLGKGKRVTMNRSCIKKTFTEKGLDYISEISLKNCYDLEKLIHWNEEHGIKFFRLSSDLVPWASEFDMEDLPDIDEMKEVLSRAGRYALKVGQRLTTHPGQFNVLCSPTERVVERCITDLTIHGIIFDWLEQPRTQQAKINIHLGGAYGDKESAMKRWCENYLRLPESVKTRITVENDDKASMYSVVDLYEGVYKQTGVPIVFDFHHHKFCTGGLSEQDALELALSTWPTDVKPVVHYSESRSEEYEDPKIKPQAHSDYVINKIDTYGNDVDVMIEAKAKELARAKYLEIHG
jgi:UV DNA damage endonuclease